jgi:hypothetical protein
LVNSKVLPAAPGTFRLFACKGDEDRIDVSRDPVVAWLAAPDSLAPITMTRTFDGDHDDPAIEFADGTVHTTEGIYQSAGAWMDDLKHGERAKASRKPETAH